MSKTNKGKMSEGSATFRYGNGRHYLDSSHHDRKLRGARDAQGVPSDFDASTIRVPRDKGKSHTKSPNVTAPMAEAASSTQTYTYIIFMGIAAFIIYKGLM